MRYLYPLLVLVAYLSFALSTIVASVLVLALPLLALSFGLLLLASLRFFSAWRLLRLGFEHLGSSFTYVGRVLRAAFAPLVLPSAPLSDGDREPGFGRHTLPGLFALAEEVAATLGTRPVDRIVLSTAGEACVAEARGRRLLVLGLPLLHVLTVDELRAVLGHEYGHFTGGHLWLSRMTRRMGKGLVAVAEEMEETGAPWLNPLYLSTRLSLWIFLSVQRPWERLQETEADATAARTFGANHLGNALRRIRDELPAVELAQGAVVSAAHGEARAPRHASEAAALLAAQMSPQDRRALARRGEGDVLDLEGRSHPPTAIRIAALRAIAARPAVDSRIAGLALDDVRAMEERMSRIAFPRAREWLDAAAWVEERRAGVRPG